MNDQLPAAAEVYHALLNQRGLSGLRRLTYRCAPHACLLLDVINTPISPLLHFPRFRLGRSEYDDRDGHHTQEKSVNPGATHYLAQAEELLPRGLFCDHVDGYGLGLSDLMTDWDNGLREVRVRRDLSRYAL